MHKSTVNSLRHSSHKLITLKEKICCGLLFIPKKNMVPARLENNEIDTTY